MPYRRLPNTDEARIRALKTAIEMSRTQVGDNVFTSDMLKAEIILRNFESAKINYKDCLKLQVDASNKFQRLVKNARLYISHFIQVLNLCVIRKEIKNSARELYKLDLDNFTVPDLLSNEALLHWGEAIIKGEKERLSQGGIPIYNPTIARVNVAYSQFKDAYLSQKSFQKSTNRQQELVSTQRETIDQLIHTLWDEIEQAFAALEPSQKLKQCVNFGVIYYLRKEEKAKLFDKEKTLL